MRNSTLDERWFKSVKERYITDYQRRDALSVVSAKERVRFLENEVENPVFKPRKKASAAFDVEAEMDFWRNLLNKVNEKEQNDIVRTLYSEKIILQLERIRMLSASLDRDHVTFMDASTKIYGKPKKKYFLYVAKRMQELLEVKGKTPHTEAHKHLHKIFSKIDCSRSMISHEVLPAPLQDDEIVTDATRVRKSFEKILRQYGLEEWNVIVDRTGTRRNFSVNASTATVHVPSTKCLEDRQKKLTKTHLKGLAEHEIGVHALRSQNGSKQPLRLLETGLPMYLRGEEGLASYKQQLVEGAEEYYGFDRYLAASLAVGLDGIERDFRSIFEIMQDYYLLMLTETEDIFDRARTGAWNTCLRIFRGTTGQQAGHIYTKDISYLEGNIRIWKMMNENPLSDEALMVGKYDPTNAKHLEALQELDIIVF